MTERKPTGVSFDSWIDRQIHEAEQRGEFKDLPGAGEPLAGLEGPYDENWWLRQKLEREGVGIKVVDGRMEVVEAASLKADGASADGERKPGARAEPDATPAAGAPAAGSDAAGTDDGTAPDPKAERRRLAPRRRDRITAALRRRRRG